MPKVSVIIPVYNVEKYLKECLDSVVNQTLKDIEIICINDGSTDNSLNILKQYATQDSRIKIIDKPNSGYGHSMNVGIDNAQGEYIGIVEPDDYIKLNMYETLYNKAKELDLDFIKADFYRFDGDENKTFYYAQIDKTVNFYNKILTPSENLKLFNLTMNTWTGIYNLDFLKKNNIRHNETPGASFQDNGFWFQTFMFAQKVYFLDKPFYMKRKDNPNSSVNDKSKIYCMCEEYDFIRNIINSKNELKKYIPVYQFKRYGNYLFTLSRIDNKYKKEFIKKFSEDYKLAKNTGEIDKNLFSKKDIENLDLIINNPDKFYKKIIKKPSKIKSFIQKIFSMKKENIYKVITIFGIKIKINRTKYLKYIPECMYQEYLKDWFYFTTGKMLNLENPQTFNEKIQWLKLYDSTPLKTKLADKYLVRDWVKEKIGEDYLIPLLGVWKNFDDIDFDKLPEKFVLKANHGSSWNIIVTDKNKFDKKLAKRKIKKWLNTNYALLGGLELHYKNIKPLIIAEEYIEADDGDLKDYKFLCFNGEVKYVWVDKDRYKNHKRNLYDINWNLVPEKISEKHVYDNFSPCAKPYNFEKMLKFANIMSKGFPFVRVDFYENDNKLYFGEMTFTSASGTHIFTPDIFNFKLGELIDLTKI